MLSKRFEIDLDELKDRNNISNPKSLRIGQVLEIPFHGQSIERTRAKASLGGGRSRGWDPNKHKTLDLGPAKRHIGKLYWPTANKGYLSSHFGKRWFSFHEGLDIAAVTGTPIYAAHDGTVVYSDNGLRGYGNMIVLQGKDILSVYAHNDRNRVRKGQRVSRGKHIADLGHSGKATGPHLHFELRVSDQTGRNVAVNPLHFFPRRG